MMHVRNRALHRRNLCFAAALVILCCNSPPAAAFTGIGTGPCPQKLRSSVASRTVMLSAAPDADSDSDAVVLPQARTSAAYISQEELYEQVFSGEKGFMEGEMNPMRNRPSQDADATAQEAGDAVTGAELSTGKVTPDPSDGGQDGDFSVELRDSIKNLMGATRFPRKAPAAVNGNADLREFVFNSDASLQASNQAYQEMLSKGDGTLAVGDGPSPDTAGSRLLDGVDSVRATEQARGQVQSLLLEMSNAAQDTGADSLFEHGSVCPRCRQMATPEEVQLWGYCSLCRAQDMSDASSDPSGRYLNKGMAGRGASLMPKDNAGSTPQRLRIANAPKQPPVSAATGDPGPSVSLPAEPPAHAGAVEAAGSGKRSSTYAKAAAERAQAGKAVNGAAGLSAGGVEVGGMGEEGGAGLARLQRVMEQLVSEQRQTNVLLAQVVAELQASAAAAQKPQATRKPRKKAGDAAAPESADDGTAQEPVTAAALAVSEEPAATAAAPAAALSKARAPRQQATAAARAQAPPPPPPAAQSISAPQRGARSAAQAPQSGGTRTRSMAQQTQPNAQRPTAEAARGTAQQPAGERAPVRTRPPAAQAPAGSAAAGDGARKVGRPRSVATGGPQQPLTNTRRFSRRDEAAADQPQSSGTTNEAAADQPQSSGTTNGS